jgi:hypothetical protein
LVVAAVDDALDLFDLLMASRLISAARRAADVERLAVVPKLEKASTTLAGAARVLLRVLADAGDGTLDVAAAWAAVEQVADRETVLGAVAVVEDLVPDDEAGEATMREILAGRYRVVRPFLELLAEAAPLRAVDKDGDSGAPARLILMSSECHHLRQPDTLGGCLAGNPAAGSGCRRLRWSSSPSRDSRRRPCSISLRVPE